MCMNWCMLLCMLFSKLHDRQTWPDSDPACPNPAARLRPTVPALDPTWPRSNSIQIKLSPTRPRGNQTRISTRPDPDQTRYFKYLSVQIDNYIGVWISLYIQSSDNYGARQWIEVLLPHQCRQCGYESFLQRENINASQAIILKS